MRTPRGWVLTWGLAWATAFAYAGALLAGERVDASLRDYVLGPTLALLTVAVGLAAALRTTGAARSESWLVVAGVACWTAGNLYYLTSDALGHQPELPSPADLGFLAMVPLVAAAFWLRARRQTRSAGGRVALDAVLAALGITAGLASGLGPVLRRAEGAGLDAAVLLTFAYPLSDLLLVALVVAVAAARGSWPRDAWAWLGGGLLVFAAADITFALRTAADTYAVGSLVDALWPIGLLMLVTGLLVPDRGDQSQRSGTFALLVPAGATGVAVTVLVVDRWTALPVLATVLAACALVVAAVRTQLAFRQVVALHGAGRQARTDSLTGLGNRRALYEDLHARQAAAQQVAVLLLDLDRFKEVNDTLGHHVGDLLLRQVGARLGPLLREQDLLTRIGGDEFAMVLVRTGAPGRTGHDGQMSGTARERDVEQVAERLVARLHEPFELDGVRLRIGASIGVACFPEDSDEVNGLVQRADIAMYAAKAGGGGVRRYDAATDLHSRQRLATLEQLRTALRTEEIVAYYQPQCDVATGHVTGVEALVRWQHPTRGLLAPDAFLDLVEQSGLMPELTGRMLGLAVRQCAQWRLDGLEVGVSVNLSASCLLQEALPDHVARLLVTHGLPAGALTLELTENSLLEDPERCGANLLRLAQLGIALSVDDYGTGYCSLSYLRDLPVHELKLDRVFLTDLDVVRNQAIVRSTVDLAHALGLRLVAEGVEDEASLELLRDLGCDLAQGYHLCRPRAANQLTGWLRGRVAGTSYDCARLSETSSHHGPVPRT